MADRLQCPKCGSVIKFHPSGDYCPKCGPVVDDPAAADLDLDFGRHWDGDTSIVPKPDKPVTEFEAFKAMIRRAGLRHMVVLDTGGQVEQPWVVTLENFQLDEDTRVDVVFHFNVRSGQLESARARRG